MKKLFKLTENFHGGSGQIFFSWQKGHNAKYLVITGYYQIVNLHDRYGNKIDSFNLNGICSGLEWNKNGDLLALITDRSSTIKIWESNNQKLISTDFPIKEPLNLLLWSLKIPSLLAISTNKGNLLIYDHSTSRKIPILGKHSKKIVSGCWTNQNLLALVCEDRVLSISDDSGDTIFQTNLKAKGNQVKSSLKAIEFVNVKSESNQQKMIESYCLSIILNRKQIILLPINALDQPFVLSFEDRYEDIFYYFWQTNGQLLIAFTSGFIINVQTIGNHLGEELVFVKAFSDTIYGISFCETNSYLAVINKNVIKLINTNNLEQIENMLTLEDEQELEWLEWSNNGQMLAVSSSEGSLNAFLMKLPNVNCSYQTKIAYLSSLLEITFIDIEQEKLDKDSKNKIQLDIEPTLIAICNSHLVACMNNRAYFYELSSFYGNNFDLVKEKEYSSIIKSMFMNDQYAAILFTDDRAILHRILEDDQQFEEDDDQQIQNSNDGKKIMNNNYYQVDTKSPIACIQLTNNFFIWCTDAGVLELFSIEEWTTVSVHRHQHPVKQICSDFMGLKILLIDEQNEAFIFDATNEQLTPVEMRRQADMNDGENDILDDYLSSLNYEDLPTDRIVVGQRNYSQTFPFQPTKLMWDSNDHSTFLVLDKKQILVYYYVAKSVQGSFVQLIGKSLMEDVILQNFQLIYDGYVYFQTATGNVSCIQLETHNYSKVLSRKKKQAQDADQTTQNSLDKQEKLFHNLLKLRRTADCWMMCKTMNKIEFWLQFIDCCLHDLNVSEAIRIARYIGHAGFVWSLKSIQNIEEWNLLAGHLAMYLQWFDLAEKLYLKSSQPTCALRLRLDLMQWNTCLVLARRLAKDQLPFIHKQQANELEFEENYQLALEHFQEALLDVDRIQTADESAFAEEDEISRHNQECLAGISRCLIKCNDRKKGVQIALKLVDRELVLKSAIICEESNLFNDAGVLYEKIGDLENACLLYLKTRNLSKVKELLQVPLPSLNKTNWPTRTILVQYGKLQEQEGKYNDAFKAYEQAEQLLDCVRLLLDKLNRPQEAVKLVRQQRKIYNSTEACLLIAKHFQQTNDYESAIEFLVYSGKLDEAFELALQESQMAIYTNALLQMIQSKSNSIGDTNVGNDGSLDLIHRQDKNLMKQLQRIAIYYEEEHNLMNSGKFFCLAGQLRKGIKNLLRAHSSYVETQQITANQSTGKKPNDQDGGVEAEDPLKLAIEFACKSNDEQSIQQVIEVLINELDNGKQTTDFQYLFKLYMCSGQYREATKTALLLAKEEQSNGNYDTAHGLLVEMCKNLLGNQLKVSFELLSALHLLHCYKLAKLYLKHENLEQSCELLCKVSNSINKFPKHAAQILSTTVVECLKLCNKTQAIHFSTTLLQNTSYLDQLDSKFRRKIENLIRKSASTRRENLIDPQTTTTTDDKACPFCQVELTKFQLSCNSCRNVILFSSLTGYHLTNDECFYCNACHLPFARKEFNTFLELENHCPACNGKLSNDTITKLETLALVS